MSTPAMHAPMAHHTASMPALGATPVRNGSPSRSGHYAGASFNNSPAASTLPLPPSFLTTPTKTPVSSMRTSIVRDEDVFGAAQPQNPAFGASLASPPQYPAFNNSAVSPPQQHAFMPVAGALNERSRHLDAMLAAAPAYPQPQYMHPVHSYSAVNLAQPSSDMSAMMQKLRLAMTLNERPATVSPMASAQVAARNAHLTPVYNA
ncbi:hypothetical protein GGF43_006064 [Coemansia sp. RSA 2618]|nr:hypothetical protein GGF43_006064 [Coemansia sp. RSA 2618]